MEKIRQRSMSAFILSSFINLGIGLAFGLIVGVLATIITEGNFPLQTMIIYPMSTAVYTALFSANLYRLYFYYTLSLDINAVCKGDGQENESFIVSAILSILTFGLYNIYWVYKLGQRLHVNAPRYGFKMVEDGKDIAVVGFLSFGYISASELIKNTNRIAKVYNQSGLADVVGGVQ